MNVVRTKAALRAWTAALPDRHQVGFVPTMGALHAGHMALVAAARRESPVVVASVFVNPTQFNDRADLARYPRQEARDAELLAAAGVDLLFLPEADEMYPADHATTVHVAGPAIGFEGDHRPGHFDGVATICLKLFSLVEPARVYLGQKDAQQVAVLSQLAQDADLHLEIRVVPTVRDTDGLALSSRNVRLSAEERLQALAIPGALVAGLKAFRDGRDPAAAARAALGGLDIDYVDVARFDGRPTLVIAARVGSTRLIDNVPLHHPELAGLPGEP